MRVIKIASASVALRRSEGEALRALSRGRWCGRAFYEKYERSTAAGKKRRVVGIGERASRQQEQLDELRPLPIVQRLYLARGTKRAREREGEKYGAEGGRRKKSRTRVARS